MSPYCLPDFQPSLQLMVWALSPWIVLIAARILA